MNGTFLVPERKVENLFKLLQDLRVHHDGVKVQDVARVTGTIISMGLALGAVSRLFTRHLYAVQNDAGSFFQRVSLSDDALMEIDFWLNNFKDLVGQPIWHSSPCIDVISYSDASSTGWAGYVVQLGNIVARGEWEHLDYLQSSTFRELKAVRLVIMESFAPLLAFKECKHRSDNQGTVSVMSIGSNKPLLQQEATKIYSICRSHGIRLFPEWIPRHLNCKADYWSRVIETDDWMLNPDHFLELDALWGPHTVDQS